MKYNIGDVLYITDNYRVEKIQILRKEDYKVTVHNLETMKFEVFNDYILENLVFKTEAEALLDNLELLKDTLMNINAGDIVALDYIKGRYKNLEIEFKDKYQELFI